jgi:hypothetical protein
MIKMQLNDYCQANPREYTYIGIGSKNRVDDVKDFHADIDQILPVFLNTVSKTIRVIHFDPYFAEKYDNGFLSRYFTSKGFMHVDGIWTSPDFRIEVIVIPEMLENDFFLKHMIAQAIKFKSQLVVQEYTGHELIPKFKYLYSHFNDLDKAYIEKNVLFDITYGTECSCVTPLTKFYPIMKDGYFLNFALYTEEKMLEMIGTHPFMDQLIKTNVLKTLSKILNEDHVNYRKAVRGEQLMFQSSNYSYNSSPEEIMTVLLKRIKDILNILEKLNALTQEKLDLFEANSRNYSELDMYKWYTNMTTLYKEQTPS